MIALWIELVQSSPNTFFWTCQYVLVLFLHYCLRDDKRNKRTRRFIASRGRRPRTGSLLIRIVILLIVYTVAFRIATYYHDKMYWARLRDDGSRKAAQVADAAQIKKAAISGHGGAGR